MLKVQKRRGPRAAYTQAVWPVFELCQLGSTHQGQSPKCEQVVGININVAHGNPSKIIALIFSWFPGELQISVPSTTSQ